MYVRMYVRRMYVYVIGDACVCMYICMYVIGDVCVCMYVRTYVRTYVCTYLRMYACSHVHMCYDTVHSRTQVPKFLEETQINLILYQ